MAAPRSWTTRPRQDFSVALNALALASRDGENYCGFLFFERLALKYSKINEAKPNNPIIETIMIPNSELSMPISL